jgi:DNA polymerase elongation subunit (family B)
VFLPSKGTGVGALTRYYGVFENETVKIRGVELRQHNTPMFLKNAQHEMLTVFKHAANAEEFRALIPKSVDVLRRYAAALRNHAVDPSDLVFTTTVSKEIERYKVHTLPKSALLQLQDLGIQVELGQSVRYLVTDESSRNYKRRVCIAEKIQGTEEIDVAYYLRQLAKCGESLLVPFDYTREKLEKML